MVTASPFPRIEEERYVALLRAANAIATCSDCNDASDTLVKKLRDVTSFDYLHLVAFDKETNLPCWSLLEAHGKRMDSSLDGASSLEGPLSNGCTSPASLWSRPIGARRRDSKNMRFFLRNSALRRPALAVDSRSAPPGRAESWADRIRMRMTKRKFVFSVWWPNRSASRSTLP